MTSAAGVGLAERAWRRAGRGPGRARRAATRRSTRQGGAQPLGGGDRRRARRRSVARALRRRRGAPTPCARRCGGSRRGAPPPPSRERLAVAVLVVGLGLAVVVVGTKGMATVSERKGVPDSASRAPRRGEGGARCRSPQARSSPAWCGLVEDHERVAGDPGDVARRCPPPAGRCRPCRACRRAGGRRRSRPARLEVQVEGLGGVGPLVLEVLGRGDHRPGGGAGARPRCWRTAASANVVLPAPGVATARKSGPWPGPERVEGRLLPAAESDLLGHAQRRTLARGTDTDEFRGRHRS